MDECLRPVGLIDFGDISIGDPSMDLSAGMIFTEETFSVFLEKYGDVDLKRQKILLFHAFCHAMNFLPYAFEQKKINLQQWAVLQLRRSMDEFKKRLVNIDHI